METDGDRAGTVFTIARCAALQREPTERLRVGQILGPPSARFNGAIRRPDYRAARSMFASAIAWAHAPLVARRRSQSTGSLDLSMRLRYRDDRAESNCLDASSRKLWDVRDYGNDLL